MSDAETQPAKRDRADRNDYMRRYMARRRSAAKAEKQRLDYEKIMDAPEPQK